jgi:hypothetical protein
MSLLNSSFLPSMLNEIKKRNIFQGFAFESFTRISTRSKIREELRAIAKTADYFSYGKSHRKCSTIEEDIFEDESQEEADRKVLGAEASFLRFPNPITIISS